jgi:serine/threonine protein kinase
MSLNQSVKNLERRLATYKPTCISDPSYNKRKITNRKQINFSELQVQPGNENYVIDYNRKIGEGGFGQVYLAVNTKNPGVPLVAKLIARANVNERSQKQEIDIGQMVDHPNLVSLDYYEYDDDIYILFFEYFSGGDLTDYLGNLGGRFSECLTFLIFYQTLQALQYLHKHNIAHLDIKLENIVFTDEEEMRIGLIDFGLSKIIDKSGMIGGFRGTMGYLPTEVMDNYDQNVKYDPYKVDVFSLGVMFYVMLTGRFPFDEIRNEYKEENKKMSDTLIYKNMKQLPESIFDRLRYKGFQEDLIDMLKGMLLPNVNKRLTLSGITETDYYMRKLEEIKNRNCDGVQSSSYEMQSPTKHLDWINLQSSPERFNENLLKKCPPSEKIVSFVEEEIENVLSNTKTRQTNIIKIIKEIKKVKQSVIKNIENIYLVKLQRQNSNESLVQRKSSNDIIVKNIEKKHKRDLKKLEEYQNIIEKYKNEMEIEKQKLMDENINSREIKSEFIEEEILIKEYIEYNKETFKLLNKQINETMSLVYVAEERSTRMSRKNS